MSTTAMSQRNYQSVGSLQMEPITTHHPILPPSPSSLKPVNTGSLYHLCRSVLDKLSTIDGMNVHLDNLVDSSDPLSKLTELCRQGLPLCTLYNALKPTHPLKPANDSNLNPANGCKANVYHFIVACRNDLLFPEEDMFTITDIYQDDTNGFVKVVNTIDKLLLLLEDRGIITVRSSNRNSDPNAPKNTRDKVVLELLETERKYVQDMEILQNYMRELQIQKIVSPDTIHYLFGNLNALVDFQRRFLIHLEEICEKQPEEQRIGRLFAQMEDSFSVYEPYCINFYSAQDLVVQETPRLQKLADILDPNYELVSLLIKPVQRICKYPLLLQELAKSTDKSWPYYEETLQGLEATKRSAAKMNESRRQHENAQKVKVLKGRLEDWTVDGYGDLLLEEDLTVSVGLTDNSNEREFAVYFFEKALMFCKESKGNNLLPKSNTLSINKKKRRGSLVPKIVFQTSSIAHLSSRCKNGIWYLLLELKEAQHEQIQLKHKNEEDMKKWLSALTKAIAVANAAENDHLMSTQLATPYTDGEDEEEGDPDFFDDEEEDYITQRSGSDSFNQQQQHQQLQQQQQQQQQPPMIRGKLSPIQAQDYNAMGRPYHNVPGMNLQPLPRSNSSLTSNSSILSTSPTLVNYSHYPVSPPPSHPSSPTTSSRIPSNGSSNWYRYGNPTMESNEHYSQKHQPHSLLATGRSQSQSAAMEMSRAHAVRPPLPLNQNRLRSQSSPNIMKNNPPPMTASVSTATHTMHDMIPHIPPRSAKPTPLDLSRPYPSMESTLRSVASTPRLTDIALSHGAPLSPGAIKIKLNFNDGIYVIVTNHEVTFFELMEKVDKKIRLVGNLKSTDLLRLKYQDEDGDFITINSDDDVQMAFESRGIHNTVNLFVSL